MIAFLKYPFKAWFLQSSLWFFQSGGSLHCTPENKSTVSVDRKSILAGDLNLNCDSRKATDISGVDVKEGGGKW